MPERWLGNIKSLLSAGARSKKDEWIDGWGRRRLGGKWWWLWLADYRWPHSLDVKRTLSRKVSHMFEIWTELSTYRRNTLVLSHRQCSMLVPVPTPTLEPARAFTKTFKPVRNTQHWCTRMIISPLKACAAWMWMILAQMNEIWELWPQRGIIPGAWLSSLNSTLRTSTADLGSQGINFQSVIQYLNENNYICCPPRLSELSAGRHRLKQGLAMWPETTELYIVRQIPAHGLWGG